MIKCSIRHSNTEHFKVFPQHGADPFAKRCGDGFSRETGTRKEGKLFRRLLFRVLIKEESRLGEPSGDRLTRRRDHPT
ncbi:unnamed protein product [Colias eurytheme]|nr:unnamed protein product [Colias eurytheme]